jgi:Methyl-accepting chemotaxis protein
MQSATENARESTRIIELVAAASLAQVDAISEISSNIEQISSVIQANSALSQESAASAQEMSAQSMVLSRIVDSFRLKNMARAPALSFNYPPPAIPEPPAAGIEGPYSYDSLGKY